MAVQRTPNSLTCQAALPKLQLFGKAGVNFGPDDADQAALRGLLPVGADVDGRDGDGRSALWHAALQGKLEVAIHLVEKLGASPTLADSHGRTPLYAAAGQAGSPLG